MPTSGPPRASSSSPAPRCRRRPRSAPRVLVSDGSRSSEPAALRRACPGLPRELRLLGVPEPLAHRDRPRHGRAGWRRRDPADGGRRRRPRAAVGRHRQRHARPGGRRPAARVRQRREQVRAAARHGEPGSELRPGGGRDRLLRVARGDAHANRRRGGHRADQHVRLGCRPELGDRGAGRRRRGGGHPLAARADPRALVRRRAAPRVPLRRLQPRADHPQRPGGARQRRGAAPPARRGRPLRRLDRGRGRLLVRQLQVPGARVPGAGGRRAGARGGVPGAPQRSSRSRPTTSRTSTR